MSTGLPIKAFYVFETRGRITFHGQSYNITELDTFPALKVMASSLEEATELAANFINELVAKREEKGFVKNPKGWLLRGVNPVTKKYLSKGYVFNVFLRIACDHCEGTGVYHHEISGNNYRCNKCKGTGDVESLYFDTGQLPVVTEVKLPIEAPKAPVRRTRKASKANSEMVVA